MNDQQMRMAQQHIDQLNAQLQAAVQQLTTREQELAHIRENNPQVAQLQQQLQDLIRQTEERDQSVAQLQIENPSSQVDQLQGQVDELTRRLAQQEQNRVNQNNVNLNDEFARGRSRFD